MGHWVIFQYYILLDFLPNTYMLIFKTSRFMIRLFIHAYSKVKVVQVSCNPSLHCSVTLCSLIFIFCQKLLILLPSPGNRLCFKSCVSAN